jgi:hypothetical protein
MTGNVDVTLYADVNLHVEGDPVVGTVLFLRGLNWASVFHNAWNHV